MFVIVASPHVATATEFFRVLNTDHHRAKSREISGKCIHDGIYVCHCGTAWPWSEKKSRRLKASFKMNERSKGLTLK